MIVLSPCSSVSHSPTHQSLALSRCLLLACLPAYLPVYLLACLPACLLSVRLSVASSPPVCNLNMCSFKACAFAATSPTSQPAVPKETGTCPAYVLAKAVETCEHSVPHLLRTKSSSAFPSTPEGNRVSKSSGLRSKLPHNSRC